MNPIDRTTYYIEEKGWFTSSLKPVAKEAFRDHQAEKKSKASSLNRSIQALAMGILAMTQSMRVPVGGLAPIAQVAFPVLSLQLWSHIPTAAAAAATPFPNAPPGPQGDEFPVNTYMTSYYGNPSVAALVGGGFIVTWESGGYDGSLSGISGQLFDDNRAKVGGEVQVNTYKSGAQDNPSVAGLTGGGFVITWQSDGQDGSNVGVYGQLFDGAGAKVGTEFPVNTYKTSYQGRPSVSSLQKGGSSSFGRASVKMGQAMVSMGSGLMELGRSWVESSESILI